MPDSFRLAAFQPDADTRKLLAELLKEADRGELVGTIIVSLRRRKGDGKRYTLSLSGWAANSITFAAGALGACQLILHRKALEEAGLS